MTAGTSGTLSARLTESPNPILLGGSPSKMVAPVAPCAAFGVKLVLLYPVDESPANRLVGVLEFLECHFVLIF